MEKGDLSGRKSSGELDEMRESGEYDQNALHPCMKLPNNILKYPWPLWSCFTKINVL